MDRCPGCGAEVYVRTTDRNCQVEEIEYECGRRHWPGRNRPDLRKDECQRRQLEALAPLVRAAIRQREDHDDGMTPGIPGCDCEVCDAVRALPEVVRERYEEGA